MQEENNLNLDNENKSYSEIEIFTKIWTSPRLVFKYINDSGHSKSVWPLLVLAGISSTFDNASTRNLGDDLSLLAIIAISVIAGGLLGWISFYIYAYLLNWTGKWLKAQGNVDSLIHMLAYSSIPTIVGVLFLIIQIGLYGNGIFQSDFDLSTRGLTGAALLWLTFWGELILGIWALVLFIVGLSEVQKLSVLKAILNALLPFIVIVVPIAIIVFIVKDLFA